MWMIVNAKNEISSYEISRALGVTQRTAWFIGHRVRMALHAGSFEQMLDGEVKVDETFIGGKARNMHADGKVRRITGRGPTDKAIVLGMLERGVSSSRRWWGTGGDIRCIVRSARPWRPAPPSTATTITGLPAPSAWDRPDRRLTV